MPYDSVERRKYVRRNVFIPVVIQEITDGKPGSPVDIACKDLSASGLKFPSTSLYPIGTKMLSKISLPGQTQPIDAKLTVVQLGTDFGENKYLIGCSFSEISDKDRNLIATQLNELDIYNILGQASKADASDVHLVVGQAPFLRIRGEITPIEMSPLIEGQVKAMLYPLLSEFQINFFDKNKNLDFAFSPNVSSRFRVNLHQQKGFLEAALRSIPAGTQSLKDLGLPFAPLEKLCREKSGLILIAGKTGSGKTTTLSSMVDYMNHHMKKIVITVEDPIEYIHVSKKCVIKQRELGSDTFSYADTLKYALRQDADIIVVGEITDKDSFLAAVKASETGHLVVSTVHAPDSVQAIERVVNLFPPEHAPSIRAMISTSLLGILFQILLPCKKGGQVVATELLINNTGIRNVIRTGKFVEMKAYFQTGSGEGMHTLENSVKKLVEQDLVYPDVIKDLQMH